jgi:hypothetical protein
MSLDPAKLEKVKNANGGIRCRCPACAEIGKDKAGDNLFVQPDGRYGCAAFQDDAEHRKRIFALAGSPPEPMRREREHKPTAQPPRTSTWTTLEDAAKSCTPKGHVLVRTWPYSREGQPFAGVARYERDGEKTFRQFHHEPNGWQTGAPTGKWPLYGALPDGGVVYLVEGEKCADAATSIGLPTLCAAGGAGAATKTDWSALKGRGVVILPDNDEAGRAYAATVTGTLQEMGARVRVLTLPDLPEGGDIADWIEMRDAAEPETLRAELERMADGVKPKGDGDTDTFIDAADYLESDPPPTDCIVEKVFERGDKIEIIGASKQKKSFFALEFCIHLAIGRNWLGLSIPKRRRVLYCNLELKATWVHRRIRKACKAFGIDAADLRGWLTVVNARGRGGFVRDRLETLATKAAADMVIVDPRYKLMRPGELENAGEGIAGILDLFDKVAESGPAVAVVHHDAKGTVGDRAIADRGGGSGWSGRDTDGRFVLTPQKTDPDTVTVVSVMARNFPPTSDFCIRWAEDHFVVDSETPPLHFTSADRQKAARGSTQKTVESFDRVALEAGKEAMSRNELLVKLQIAGASRDMARATVEGLLRRKELVCTPRAGSKNGVVKYGTPEAIREYMNPTMKL